MKLFTCAKCKGTFEEGWSDAEAVAESKATFGFYPGREEVGVLCDDCYQDFMKWFREQEKKTR